MMREQCIYEHVRAALWCQGVRVRERMETLTLSLSVCACVCLCICVRGRFPHVHIHGRRIGCAKTHRLALHYYHFPYDSKAAPRLRAATRIFYGNLRTRERIRSHDWCVYAIRRATVRACVYAVTV